jgi:hypothetical protein
LRGATFDDIHRDAVERAGKQLALGYCAPRELPLDGDPDADLVGRRPVLPAAGDLYCNDART